MEVIETITIDQVRAAKPKMIYYGYRTCWWTHDPAHLGTKPDSGLPCDPRGGVLLQTDDVDGFLAHTEANFAHYGRHGLRAFMAAHHLNCIVGNGDARHTCGTSWDEYNDAIDRLDARKETRP